MVVAVCILIPGLCSWDSEAEGCHALDVGKVLLDMITTQLPVISSAGI